MLCFQVKIFFLNIPVISHHNLKHLQILPQRWRKILGLPSAHTTCCQIIIKSISITTSASITTSVFKKWKVRVSFLPQHYYYSYYLLSNSWLFVRRCFITHYLCTGTKTDFVAKFYIPNSIHVTCSNTHNTKIMGCAALYSGDAIASRFFATGSQHVIWRWMNNLLLFQFNDSD